MARLICPFRLEPFHLIVNVCYFVTRNAIVSRVLLSFAVPQICGLLLILSAYALLKAACVYILRASVWRFNVRVSCTALIVSSGSSKSYKKNQAI